MFQHMWYHEGRANVESRSVKWVVDYWKLLNVTSVSVCVLLAEMSQYMRQDKDSHYLRS